MEHWLVSESDIFRAERDYKLALCKYGLTTNYKPPMRVPCLCGRALPKRKKTNIVLLPGFNSIRREWELFINALKPWGDDVVQAQVDVKLGNRALTDNLYQWLNGQGLLSSAVPLTLIGFSNGGLICRALLHKYGCLNVKRVLMIGTPNWGTSLAAYGRVFSKHPGLKDLSVGSKFLSWLNKNYTASRIVPHHVIIGDAAHDREGEHFDGVVWESSATAGYMFSYVRVQTGEPVVLYLPNSAWHLNLTRKSWRKYGLPSNDKAWPITLNYIRRFLAEQLEV